MFKPRRVDEHHTESFLKPLLATFQSRSPCFLFSIFWIFKLGLSESSVYTQKSSPFNRKGPFGGIRKKHHFQTRHLWILIHIQADADIFSYTSAISACEKGGQWQQALNFFVRMTLAKLQPQLGGIYCDSLCSCDLGLFDREFVWLKAMPFVAPAHFCPG